MNNDLKTQEHQGTKAQRHKDLQRIKYSLIFTSFDVGFYLKYKLIIALFFTVASLCFIALSPYYLIFLCLCAFVPLCLTLLPHRLYTFVPLCLCALFITSCSTKITPKTGEYLIYSQTFKGNKQISTEDLASVIPNNQNLNIRPFGLPILPGVALYDVGKKYQNVSDRQLKIESLTYILEQDSATLTKKLRQRLEKQIAKQKNIIEEGHWLMKTGEAPAFVREAEIKETANKIQTYLHNRGYLEAKITLTFSVFQENKVRVIYDVQENKPYLWRKIEYRIKDSQIDSLVRKTQLESPLKKDPLLNRANLEAERVRIERLLKENGYYAFSKQYVRMMINDTIKSENEQEKMIDIIVSVENPVNKKHTIYSFESVQLTALDVKKASAEIKSDVVIDTNTSTSNGIKYIFVGRNFPVKLLNSRISIRPNSIYSVKNREQTEQQLSALEQFTFTNIKIDTLSKNRLKAVITAPTLNKYEITNEIGLNSVGLVAGGALNSVFKMRNLFGNLETLELNGRFAYEGSAGYNNSFQRSPELSLNTSFVFPDLLFPKSKYVNKYQNPKTRIGLGFSYSAPPAYHRYNFRLSANYLWQTSKHKSFTFSPLDVNIVRTDSLANKSSRDFFTFLDSEFLRGNNLKLLFGRQFTSSINGSYIYNTQVIGQNINAQYLRIFAEAGGTFLNLIRNKNNPEPWLDKVIGQKLQYFQFVKFNVDYRKNIPLSRNKMFAYRINTGFALPYGENSVLPYEKNFFVGGANSIRAWSPRTLGPGSSKPDLTKESKQYLPQPGDILIEGSAEYRTKLFHFIGDINGAVFVDVGNVWKLREVPTKINQADFKLNRFWKEFAIGTGFGLRFDMSYFVLRIDSGIKVYDPSQSGSNRFVLGNIFLSKAKIREIYPDPYRIMNWFNIGIGYPF